MNDATHGGGGVLLVTPCLGALLSDRNNTLDILRLCIERPSAGGATAMCGRGQTFSRALMPAMAEAGRGKTRSGATAEDFVEPLDRKLDPNASCLRHRLCEGTAEFIKPDEEQVSRRFPSTGR